MDTEYRRTGVGLVARALGCVSLTLMVQDLRGKVRATTWDDAGDVLIAGWVADGALLRRLGALDVLRPALDDSGAIVVTVQSADLGLAGWRLVGARPFARADVAVAARLASVLADPGMREPETPAPRSRQDHARHGGRPGGDRPTPAATPPAPTALLTAREAEILTLVGEGMTARAIARRCGISERTVQKHLEQVYRKLDCHDRVSAVLLARDCGLLGTVRLVTVA